MRRFARARSLALSASRFLAGFSPERYRPSPTSLHLLSKNWNFSRRKASSATGIHAVSYEAV